MSAVLDRMGSNIYDTCLPNRGLLLLLLLLLINTTLRVSKEAARPTNVLVMSRCQHSSPPTEACAHIFIRERLLAMTGSFGNDHLKLKWCSIAPKGTISQLNLG